MSVKKSLSELTRYVVATPSARREWGRVSRVGHVHLSKEDVAEIGRRLDEVQNKIVADLGERDRKYIYRIISIQRIFDTVGRGLILLSGKNKKLLFGGVSLLSVAKILDNMEIGHNVMHGQYDWLGDPALSSKKFDWDNVCPSDQWIRTHNHEHHTFTNITGLDKDLGFNILRVTRDQPWTRPALLNLPLNVLLMIFFEWGVMGHEAAITQFWNGERDLRDKVIETLPIFRGWFVKLVPQILKDYVLFPLLRPRFYLQTAGANLIANLVRNVWAHSIIFCGHFPDEVHTFSEEECSQETKGEWYVRQMLGSCNIYGSRLFHIFTGNLSHQIEHHLLPNIPAHRYREVAPVVRQICSDYNLPYNSGPFFKQISKVWRSLAKNSLPDRFSTAPHRMKITIERVVGSGEAAASGAA